MAAYFTDLKKKAQKKIKKAMKLWDKKSDCGGSCDFDQNGPGAIVFSRDDYDGLTGMRINGQFNYNRKGVVTAVAQLSEYKGQAPDFYFSVDLLGKKGFKKFAKTSYKRSYELTEIVSTYGYDDQRVADWIDALPGANPYDSASTTVGFGQPDVYALA